MTHPTPLDIIKEAHRQAGDDAEQWLAGLVCDLLQLLHYETRTGFHRGKLQPDIQRRDR